MPDDLRPLRAGRFYTEAELAAHALRAVDRVTGRGKPFPTRAALAAALRTPDRVTGEPKPVTPSSLSFALALADPARKETADDYKRGTSVRRAILRQLAGFVVSDAPAFGVEEAPPGGRLTIPEPPR